MINRWRLTGAGALSIGAAAIVVACASAPDTSETTTIFTTSTAFSDFAGGATASGTNNAGVVGFVTHTCGTLDCHGEIGRPFRLFSHDGLRLVDEAGAIPGGAPTTEAEIFADYTSAISVQPELTSKVFAGLEDPHVLLLLRKPLGLERHKGGTVISSGSDADTCLSAWLSGGLGAAGNQACNNASQIP